MRPVVFFIGIILVVRYSLATTAAKPETAVVRIEAIQCVEGRTEPPQLLVAPASGYPNLRYQPLLARVRELSEGYYEIVSSVAQGNYFFEVQSPHCSNSLQTAVLAGHERILSIALLPRLPIKFGGNLKLFSLENSVAGSLPVRPEVAYLVSESGAKRVLDLQDTEYYIDRVPPGKYAIRMEFHGGFQSEIPVDLTDISLNQLIVRDISIMDVRRHIGNISASGETLQKCAWCF
jgi:hypothetical protein